ncbi:MAG: S8 family serine peptidase [Bacilli bacterium]|nr:S8 family serine peptidase [Bacilli bacterium]
MPRAKGVTIGIIDTGLYLNQVEGTSARATAESEGATCEKDTTIKYTLNPAAFRATSDVTETLSQSALDTQFAEAGGEDYFTYVNKKVPFARNYADHTKDVTPGKAGEHGTHVASLAAANGTDFSGIAPNAQIAVLKVFSANSAGGAGEPAIIAALEDAAKLKLDIVNLSLGTDLTDFDDTISNSTFQAVQGASDAGVIVNYSAGNAGKSNFNSATGYADYTTSTVEPSMIGSSSLYDEKANIIAATTPEKAFYSSILLAEGEALSYSDQIIKRNVKGQQDVAVEHRITDLLGDESSKDIPFVRIPGLGTDSDFQQSMVNNSKDSTDANAKKTYLNGKVAVIDRGSCPFVEKIDNAMAYGAAGVIVINNLPGAVSMNMDISTDIDAIGGPNGIPVGFTALSSSTPLKGDAGGNGTFQLAKNQVENAPDGNSLF